MLFCCAWYCTILITWLSNSTKSILSIDNSNLPASIFEKSKISLIISNKELADCKTVPMYCLCVVSNSVFINKSVKPMIPLSGVRISWLIFAKNSDLALLASSACCLAICSSLRVRCCSLLCFRALISKPIVEIRGLSSSNNSLS